MNDDKPMLFSKGSTLADVPPGFKGISYHEWRLRDLSEQAEQWRAVLVKMPVSNLVPIATARDNYGMKGPMGFRRNDQ